MEESFRSETQKQRSKPRVRTRKDLTYRTVRLVATRGGGDGLVARRVHSPPFSRRGGCAIYKKIPFLSGADGVVSKRSRSLLMNIRVAHLNFLLEFTNRAVCAAKERDLFIKAQPPLLENGG